MDPGTVDSPLRIGSTRRIRGNNDPDFDRGPIANSENLKLFNARIGGGGKRGGSSGGAVDSSPNPTYGASGSVGDSGSAYKGRNYQGASSHELYYQPQSAQQHQQPQQQQQIQPSSQQYVQPQQDQSSHTSQTQPSHSTQPPTQQPHHPTQQQHYHQSQPPVASSSRPNLQTAYELGVNLPTVEKLIGEIQSAYFDISRLEVKCLMLSKQIEDNQHIIQQSNLSHSNGNYGDNPTSSRLRTLAADLSNSSDGSTFDSSKIPPEYWAEAYFLELYQNQANLIDKYFDFMFLAYHPCGNSVTRGLVKKYKIPIRMWNKGIFKFLDILRAHMPKSQDLITKFIYHCFSLLTMLVDPPYESRYMWLEALGDLARFSMALGNISHGEWRGVSQYWYSRAANRSPGVGRLFHHCAVVCIYRLDSLFYFCKSLTTSQQFEPSRETILSLFESNQEGEANTPIALFIKLHQVNFTQSNVNEFPSILSDVISSIMARDRDYNDLDLKNRGAILAYCNVTSLLGYGSLKNPAAAFFYELSKIRGGSGNGSASSGSGNSNSVTSSTNASSGSLYMAQQISFEMLRQFLTLPRHIALLHIIVWLHFLNSLTDNQEICYELLLNDFFPASKLVKFLNEGLRVVESILTDNANVLNNKYYRGNNNKASSPVGFSSNNLLLKSMDSGSSSPLSSTTDLDSLLQRISAWKQGYNSRSPSSEDSIELISAKLPNAEERGHYPLLRERPLPEELLLLGFVWSYKTVKNELYTEYESSTTDEPFPGQAGKEILRPIREVRAIELAISLVSSNSWLGFRDGYFCLEGSLRARHEDHMSDSEYVASPMGPGSSNVD